MVDVFTRIGGTLAPMEDTDNYPTHLAKFGRGGYRSVDSILDLYAISAERREIGMVVFVKSQNRRYVLVDGVENVNWQLELIPENYRLYGFNFTFFNVGGNKKGYMRTATTGNMKKSLAMLTSSDINVPSSYPKLILPNKVVNVYPMNHSLVLGKTAYGMSPDNDPCIITENKIGYYLYIEVTNGTGIIKCTHKYDDVNSPHKDLSKEIYVIGLINPNGFPIIPMDDLGYIHRETAQLTNPHNVTFEQTIDANNGVSLTLSELNSELWYNAILELVAGYEEDRYVSPIRVNSYMQSAPAIDVYGDISISENALNAGQGASLKMQATDGNIVVLKVQRVGDKYELALTPI